MRENVKGSLREGASTNLAIKWRRRQLNKHLNVIQLHQKEKSSQYIFNANEFRRTQWDILLWGYSQVAPPSSSSSHIRAEYR